MIRIRLGKAKRLQNDSQVKSLECGKGIEMECTVKSNIGYTLDERMLFSLSFKEVRQHPPVICKNLIHVPEYIFDESLKMVFWYD